MTKREIRALETEIRAVGDDAANEFEATVVRYDTEDSYGSTWAPGCFTEELEARLPKAVFSHDWSRPVGRVVGYTDTSEGLDVRVKLADPEKVPDAKMVRSLLSDGVLDSFSIGFVRLADKANPDGTKGERRTITKARIEEVSTVLVGAIPGTRTLAVRSDNQVPASFAADIITRFEHGELDLADALSALKRGSAPGEFRTLLTEASVPKSTTGALPKLDPAKRALKRTPHAYVPTNTSGSVCKTCGGQMDMKAHTRAETSVEIRDLTLSIASDAPEPADTPEDMLTAADAAIDAAITLASWQDLTNLPSWVAQMLALVMAADACLDECMEMMGVVDPDEINEDVLRSFAPARKPDPKLSELEQRLAKMGRK